MFIILIFVFSTLLSSSMDFQQYQISNQNESMKKTREISLTYSDGDNIAINSSVSSISQQLFKVFIHPTTIATANNHHHSPSFTLNN